MAFDKHYPWIRYWAPRDQMELFSASAFVPDPEAFLGAGLPMHELASLRDVPLLILLGQPGQGKSTAIGDEADALSAAGVLTRRVDLLGVDSGLWLRDELVNSEEVRAWRKGAELHVFVDGLDRAQVELSTVQRVLEQALQAPAPAMARLRLRIACRSADWEEAVADRLAGLWSARDASDERVANRAQVLELLNLSYGAFALAAEAHELDPGAVFAEVSAKGAEPLAAVPVTLAMILDAFAEDGVLGTRTELYQRACQRLVSEGTAVVDGRVADALALAARQAAALMLCDAAGLTTSEQSTRSEVTIFDLAGGTEPTFGGIDAQPAVVERQPLRDLHNTGLMSAAAGRVVFIHQTIAEYLCAVWLASGRLARQQVEALLVNPYDSRRQLLPHLRDVAGWLAALDPSAFGMLIQTQARVLLRGDVALLEPRARRELVAALLVPDEGDRIPIWDRQIRDSFRLLGHPALVEQLREPIRDSTVDEDVRLVAIALAEANHAKELVDELLAVALDSQSTPPIRRTAVEAVGAIGDESARQALLPLALGELAEDDDDNIKGVALAATWPGLMDTATLLTALKPPKQDSYYGSYQAFLSRAAADIPSAGLVAAVDWATDLRRPAFDTSVLTAFADGVIERAWDELAQDGVADALTRFALAHLENDRELVARRLRKSHKAFQDLDGRREIVGRLLHRVGDPGVHPRYLLFSRPALIRHEDVDWLCDMLAAEQDREGRRRWAKLIDAAFLPEHSPVNRVLEAAFEHDELADELRFWLGSVLLDSEDARVGRQRYAEINPVEQDEDEEDRERVDFDGEIQTLIEAGEAGDSDAWWRICALVIYDVNGRAQVHESSPRVTASPAWARADDTTRERLLDLAARHVATNDPSPDEWVGQTHGWRPARAGAQALILLEELRRDDWLALGAERWETWAPAIVGFPWADADGAKPITTMLRRLGELAPTALTRWAETLVRVAEGHLADYIARSRIPPVMEVPGMLSAVLSLAGDDELRTELRVLLISVALDVGEGVQVALELLKQAVGSLDDPGADGEREFVVGLLSTTLTRAPAAAWPMAWQVIVAKPDIGRQLVEGLATTESYEIARGLEEAQVADLYLWLLDQYPRAEDPALTSGILSMRQQIAWWRDRLIEVLIQRRTEAGVEALRRLHTAHPEIPFMARRLRAAEVALAEALWTPPRPRELVRLAEDRNRRLVQSPEQMQAVVLESLARANERLQGEWPKAWQLWNDAPLQPKSEERLSDWLKDWLDADLALRLVTTREPQVRPTRLGSGIGARNDLRVELGADGDRSALALVIEVKRCWHPKVFSAAKTQLADDYLASENLSHGIYLVGYYDAPGWVGAGSKVARRRDLEGWRSKIADVAEIASHASARNIASFVFDISLRSDRAS